MPFTALLTTPMEGIRRLYSGPLKSFFESLGLHPWLDRMYWGLRLAILSDIQKVCTANTCASFYVDTKWEYLRLLDGEIKEADIVATFLANMRPNDTFWDIGANIGVYTCMAANRHQDSIIVAFEPHPTNYNRLVSNLGLNGQVRRVTVRQEAVGATDKVGSLYLDPVADTEGRGRHTLERGDQGDTIIVDVRSGDSLVANDDIPPPDIIKIDVEGGELEVLRGLESTVEQAQTRVILVEVHPDQLRIRGATVEMITDWFDCHGFRHRIIGQRKDQSFVLATKEDL